MSLNKRGVGFVTDDKDMSVTLADGRLRCWSYGSGYTNVGRRIHPDDDYIHFPMSVLEPIENPVQPAHSVPLVFAVIAPGNADSRQAAVDINVFHCVHGHANDFLLREAAKSLGMEQLGDSRPCTGCSMFKGYRKPIANSIKSPDMLVPRVQLQQSAVLELAEAPEPGETSERNIGAGRDAKAGRVRKFRFWPTDSVTT